MANIIFSVVVTVFNEEKSIELLLHSLLNQTHKPGEIIFVDAGSTDATVSLIKTCAKTTSIPIHVVIQPGANRSVGRNLGILSAAYSHIAVTDAGCEADSHWLEVLAIGFNGAYQAVAGFYRPVIDKPIQRLFAAYVSTLPNDLDETTFLPSSRSLAFTKEIWESAGRYPEKLNTCEDLVFAAGLKQTGKMTVCPNALVSWRQAGGFSEFFAAVRGYAWGDAEAMYMPHVYKILSVWLRYLLFIFIPLLWCVYILYPLVKHRREITRLLDIMLLPMVQLTADGAVLVGSIEGGFKRLVR